ncbi:MAG: hypothetical protein RLZZ214_3858 [Verrucomicrobiota bacterium]
MNEKAGKFELMEPPSPEALVPDSWFEPWMLAVAVIVVLAVLAFLLLRKKKAIPFDPQAAREAAHTEAAGALAQIDSTHARDAAVQASLILRKYLSLAAGDPALFETHEETLSRHEAFNGFSDEARHAAGSGFSRLAALKYSPAPPDVAPSTVITESNSLLEILHHGFKA